MFISIGGEFAIKSKDIVAILDQHIIDESEIMGEFIKTSSETAIQVAKGPYKSIVITADKVYFSPLSSATLIKRSYHQF